MPLDRHRGVKVFLWLLMAAAFAAMTLMADGCLGGGETTLTVEKTVTVISTPSGTPAADKEVYAQAIKDLTRRADQINTDYRAAVDQYNSGQTGVEDMMARADEDRRAYEEMSAQLTGMKVPPEFTQPHQLLISGFNKWQSAFEAYRNGFRDNDNNMLAKAGDLDSQAVIEVNQAINQISQVE